MRVPISLRAPAHPPARAGDARRAILVSAAVGTALVALNQGDLLLAAAGGAPMPGALAWKIPLTYLVPFLVSYGSSRAAARAAERVQRGRL